MTDDGDISAGSRQWNVTRLEAVPKLHGMIGRANEELYRVALEDLRSCFTEAAEARVTRWQVVREREATVSLGVGAERLRPAARTRVGNLFLAGDWTATGLPASIESAVVSGERAAEAVLQADGAAA